MTRPGTLLLPLSLYDKLNETQGMGPYWFWLLFTCRCFSVHCSSPMFVWWLSVDKSFYMHHSPRYVLFYVSSLLPVLFGFCQLTLLLHCCHGICLLKVYVVISHLRWLKRYWECWTNPILLQGESKCKGVKDHTNLQLIEKCEELIRPKEKTIGCRVCEMDK